MLPAAFEHTTPAGDRPQTHTLDRSATGIGYFNHINHSNCYQNRLGTVTWIDCKNWDLITSIFNTILYSTFYEFYIIGLKMTNLVRNLLEYEGYSKINLRLIGRNKRVVIASKRTLSSNKELLFLL